MRIALLTIAAALSVAACGDKNARLVASYPDDAAYVAAVWLADGRPIAASGMLRAEEATNVSLEADVDGADQTALLAWTLADLERVELPADGVLAATLLAGASDTDPLLPPPSWSGLAAGADGVLVAEMAPSAVALTASWLPRCPTVLVPGERHTFDMRCSDMPCGEVSQDGCRLTIDTTVCGFGRFEVELDGRGEPTPLTDDAASCFRADVDPPARYALDCQRCRFDFYSLPADAETFAEVDYFELRPAPANPKLRVTSLGVAPGLVVLPEVVVASSFDDGDDRDTCRSGSNVSRLHWFDVQTATSMGTSTVAGCITALAPDPTGDGVIALDATSVVRVDAAGRELERVVFDELPGTSTHTLAAIEIVDDPLRIAVITQAEEFVPGRLTWLAFEPLRRLGTYEMQSRGATLLYRDPVLLVGQNGTVDGWDPGSESLSFMFPLEGGEGVSDLPSTLVPVGSFVLSLSLGRSGGIITTDLSTFIAPARYYVEWGNGTTGAQILGEDVALVAVTAVDEPNRTVLAKFDAVRQRYLPETVEIGNGPARGLARSSDGAYWGVLTATGRLFRAMLR